MSDCALAAFSSLIQNSQSFAGTLISAFGNAIEPSAARIPLVWSGCRWDMMTMSTFLGAMAAVEQHQFAAGVDQLRSDRHRHHALRHIGSFGSGERLILAHVRHPLVGQR